jgi:hypothetical protein
MTHNNDLPAPFDEITPALVNAIQLWVDATTDAASPRRHDLQRDKIAALLSDGQRGRACGFFALIPKPPQAVTPLAVKTWQAHLEAAGLSPSSVYARVSRLSSFFEWLVKAPPFRETVKYNPVTLSRPKAPKAYQSERTQALTDREAAALLTVVKGDAQGVSAGFKLALSYI